MRRMLLLFPVVVTLSVLLVDAAEALAQNKETAKATATRKKLETKVTVNWKDTLFRDIADEIKEMVPGVIVRLDLKGGVSNNRKLTYSAKDKPLKDALTEMLSKEGLGWYVISNAKDPQFDGAIFIKLGKEQGFPEKDK